jgi:hypothetical protein
MLTQARAVSNYHYLIFINALAQRSFSDIAQVASETTFYSRRVLTYAHVCSRLLTYDVC